MALAFKRFPEGSAERPARDEAEAAYAKAMAQIGSRLGDAAVLAMAAEAHMNLSPWDYYQASHPSKGLQPVVEWAPPSAVRTVSCRVHASKRDCAREASMLRFSQ